MVPSCVMMWQPTQRCVVPVHRRVELQAVPLVSPNEWRMMTPVVLPAEPFGDQ